MVNFLCHKHSFSISEIIIKYFILLITFFCFQQIRNFAFSKCPSGATDGWTDGRWYRLSSLFFISIFNQIKRLQVVNANDDVAAIKSYDCAASCKWNCGKLQVAVEWPALDSRQWNGWNVYKLLVCLELCKFLQRFLINNDDRNELKFVPRHSKTLQGLAFVLVLLLILCHVACISNPHSCRLIQPLTLSPFTQPLLFALRKLKRNYYNLYLPSLSAPQAQLMPKFLQFWPRSHSSCSYLPSLSPSPCCCCCCPGHDQVQKCMQTTCGNVEIYAKNKPKKMYNSNLTSSCPSVTFYFALSKIVGVAFVIKKLLKSMCSVSCLPVFFWCYAQKTFKIKRINPGTLYTKKREKRKKVR